ncbi:uncharacterized protein LUBEL [Hetaerina americana]|uniref:uncharacterized protein LUBEL n=1 Tax=Hetaerina americana TaxID=62018 RepID=UPI003A7F49E7
MSMQERWRKPMPGRPRPTRPMPHWMVAASAAGVKVGGDSPPRMPPPPPPPDDPEYEVIDVNSASYMNGPPRPPPFGAFRKGTGRHCDLCGGSTPAVRCDLCSGQIFCSSCDDMYHRHPKRQSHVRKVLEAHTLTRPPLPPRGEIGMAPVPPPRSRQKRVTTLFRLPSTGGLLSSLGKERQDGGQMKKEFSLSEKMGSLRRMMGSRPLPPTPPPQGSSLGGPPRTPLPGQPLSSAVGSPSKFHTMREGSLHSSFRQNSDGRWRHPSLTGSPQSPMKSPGLNGFRGASMGDLWDQGSMGGMRDAAFHRGSPPSMEQMGINWPQSPGSDGRSSPWPQSAFGDAATASLSRRRRSELTPPWNNGWQRGGMVSSASVTDLNAGLGPWGGSGPPLQQAQSMAHLHHCPGCMINPAGHPWGGMPMHHDHWHGGNQGWGGSMLQLWPHHPPTVMVPPSPHHAGVPQQPPPEVRHPMAEGGWMNPSPWEDGGGGGGPEQGAPSSGGGGGEGKGDEGGPEDEDKAVLFVPNYAWPCEHCTFVNQPGTRVCSVCCKTTTAEGQRGMKVGGGAANVAQRNAEWASNPVGHPNQREEVEEAFPKGSSEAQKDKRREVVSVHEDGDESSEEESIVTAVQEMEGHRWKSYSPRPQKASAKANHFRSIAKSPPPSTASSGIGDDRYAQHRRINKSPVSVTSTGVGDDRPSQFRRIAKSPVPMMSNADRPSQMRRMTKSPVIMMSTGVGDERSTNFRRTSRSPITTVSTAVGDDRPSPFRRVTRSPVPTMSTGVGDDRPFSYRKVANSPTVMPSNAVGDDRAMNPKRMNSYPVSTKSTATGTEEVVMKVSMAVGTSPPRAMKVEKQILGKASSMASVGTSPPPQSISTQTYDNPTALTSSSKRKTSADFGSQVSIGQENSSLGNGSLGQYAGTSRRMPRLRRTLSLTFNSKQRETTPNAFLRSQSRHSICGNSGEQSTPEPPAVPLRRRIPSSSTTSSEYYNPSGEADGEWSGGDDDRKEGDKVHGLELVRLLREAEQHQFTAEEVEVALKQCGNKMGDGGKGPLAWLKANWLQMVDTVATLATNFGLERRENTVGNVSTAEGREALRKEGGDVWAAVTHCVEARQRKYAELVSRGNFTREDIVSALSNSQGNVEIAFNELSKSQLKPFLMRIWGPPVSGTGDNESGNSALRAESKSSSVEEISHILEEGSASASSKPVKEEEKSEESESKPPGGMGSVENERATVEEVTVTISGVKTPKEGAQEEKSTVAGEGEHKDEVETMAVAGSIVAAPPEVGPKPEPGDQEEKGAAELESGPKDAKKDESEGFERMARQLLAEGHVNSYERAEVAAILVLKENIGKAEALLAVQECNSVDAALSYLRQECLLCTGEYPMNQMVSMLTCVHRCCQDCARLYFTVQIRDRSIEDAVCPFCKEPKFPKRSKDDSDIEEAAVHYYSNLDILLKAILDPKDHELFHRKLRDRTLANEANFKWCTKCSSGFISDPRQKRLVCPDCKSITCASCHRPWAKQHEGVSCNLFAQWLEENDPATQAAGLARHLAESTEAMLSCPRCKCNFSLARGGCMHLTCPQCRHEFCSGCDQTFAMGTQCMDGALNKEEDEEESSSVAAVLARGQAGHPCARLGLHAHHPRDCLFYLRDMEPIQLEKLLTDNGIDFNKKNPEPANEDEGKGKDNGAQNMKCQVQVQREGPTGLLDGICEEDVPKDHAGLCRLHYMEYLVGVMRRAGLDPAPAFDQHEAIAELRRRHVAPPDRPQGMSDADYKQICIELIQKMIPLKTVTPPKVQDK